MGVLSNRLARRLEPGAGRALEKLLAAMGEPPLALWPELSGGARQLGYLAEARGLAYRPDRLEEGWQDGRDGYFLIEAEEGLTALCPRPLGGYFAYHETGGRLERVGRKGAAKLQGAAWQVFPSLPERCRTARAAVWHYLHTQCGPLLLLLALLLALAGGLGTAAARLVRAVFWEVLPGALPWRAVVAPLAAVLLLGGGAVKLALGAAARITARAAEPGGAALAWRRTSRGGDGPGDPEGGCVSAARMYLLLYALAILILAALPGLWGAIPAAARLLACGAGSAAACGALFRREGRLPPGFPAGLAALWTALGCVQLWAAGLGLAEGAAYLAAFLPPAAVLLLLAREAPAFAAALRRAARGAPPSRPPRDDRPPLLSCDGSLSADEAAAGILRPVSLRLAPGEKVGIYGPAGSGKSTLLRLLSGALPPKSGVIYCGGRDCAEVQTASIGDWVRLLPRADADSIALALKEPPAVLLADHISDRRAARAALAFEGTAVLASARRSLLAGCGRIFRLDGGVLREEDGGE